MTTVLITGANRGIGLELARQYAAEGAEVLACCRTPEKAEALADLAALSGARVRILKLDVADSASIAALKRELGDAPIDILINNAGVGGPRERRAEDIDAEAWLQTLRINAVAPVMVVQALLPNLKRGQEKKVVAITSGMGSTAGAGGGSYAYRSSKAALNNAMRGLARDWARDGIVVAILHPGWVRTDMGGPNAAVSPEESAEGLRQQIAGVTDASSGEFRDYRGAAIPW